MSFQAFQKKSRPEMLHRADSAFVVNAFGFLLILMWFFTHTTYDPSKREWTFSKPQVISGDEPHYLLMVNSLLFDHDLQLQDDYSRIPKGEINAGKKFKGSFLDHHTILFDPVSKEHALWNSIFDRFHRVPCYMDHCQGFFQNDLRFTVTERTIEFGRHSPGFPVVTAAFLALTRSTPEQVEGRMFYFTFLCAWLTAVLVFFLARKVGVDRGHALFAAFLLALGSSWLLYAQSYYSEPFTGLILVIGLWWIYDERPVLAGIAMGIAVSIKPVFILVGFGWFIERIWSRQYRVAFILGFTTVFFFLVLEGIYYLQMGFIHYWGNVGGGAGLIRKVWTFSDPFRTLLDPSYGLFLFVPWTLISFYALILSIVQPRKENNKILRLIALPTFIFLIVFSSLSFLGWTCYGPRYWIPFLPWLALAFAVFLAQSGKWVYGMSFILAFISIVFSISASFVYPSVWDMPPQTALNLLISRKP